MHAGLETRAAQFIGEPLGGAAALIGESGIGGNRFDAQEIEQPPGGGVPNRRDAAYGLAPAVSRRLEAWTMSWGSLNMTP